MQGRAALRRFGSAWVSANLGAMDGEAPRQALQIDYPCPWVYRLLGESEAAIRAAIAVVVQEREHAIAIGRSSRGGRYLSVHLRLVVTSDGDRTTILSALQTHSSIRYIL